MAVLYTLTSEPVTKVSVVNFSDLTTSVWWRRSFITWPVWISHTLQGGQGVRHMYLDYTIMTGSSGLLLLEGNIVLYSMDKTAVYGPGRYTEASVQETLLMTAC